MMKKPSLRALLVFAGMLFSCHAVAAPGTPNITWMATTYDAPAEYTVTWNMWWGNNGDVWYLEENGSVIHTGTLVPNGQNQQTGSFTISKTAGGTYGYQVRLCDSSTTPESCSQSNTTTITVNGGTPPVNQPPVPNAGADQAITLGNGASLSGSYTDDGLSTPITVSWSQAAGPGITTFANANLEATTATFSVAGTYTLRLSVSDGEFTATDDVVVTVNPAPTNQPPVANAGVDQSVEFGTPANLSGSYSDDGLSTPITVSWSQVAGPATGITTFANASAEVTTATFSVAGAYTLRLSVNDGEFTGTDDVVVTVTPVQPNQAPVANAGPDQPAAPNQAITLAGTFTDDGKAGPITETWAKVSGPGTVAFSNPSAGNSTATFGTAGAYVLSYTVNDSEFSSSDQINVTVTDGPPPTAPAAPAIAWMSNDVNLDSGPVDLNVRWNVYWGENGNEWRLLQNGAVVHTEALIANSPSAQSGSKIVTISEADNYAFVVSLCNVVGAQEACTNSNPFAVTASGGVITPPGGSCGNGTPCLPNRADPVNLEVKGWPSTLAMGTITDNSATLNAELAASKVDAIFKYEGDGAGNRGMVIEPSVTLQTIRQARDVEALNGGSVIPTMVVYTANASGGGVASEDILTYANLVMHYQNLIRMTATMQVHKDAAHPNPGSIVLNADLFGEWQSTRDTAFTAAYGDANAWTAILIKQALKEAIDKEATYQVTDINGVRTALGTLYDLNALKLEIDTALEDNILGWVQSQNFVIKRFSPDVSFGWVVNLWNPGSANWAHTEYSGLRAIWNAASKSVAGFIDDIGAYANAGLRPDFLTFDKYERDGFSPAGRGNYAFGARQWYNYLTYVRQITDHVDTPAMIWQIPGGHMATVGENIGTYDLANHSASAGSYFMGDKNIGTSLNNIRSEVLSIPLSATVYDGANSVSALLQQTPNHDWGISQLRQAAYSNVFAVMWGGGSTTAVVPIATNGSGDNGWLKNKVIAYQTSGKIPLYFDGGSSTGPRPLTSIPALNTDLESIETVMDNDVLLFQTPSNAWVPSSIYKWADFLAALNAMHNDGVENVKFWLLDPTADDATNTKYAKVAIAAFLAQSMKETIQYDACDENNWSINTGEPVNYPLSAGCGQLGQVYADYGTNPVTGNDNPYSCPRNPKMEISALTHAKWYGAPGPLFVAPDAVLQELGLLVNGSVGKWDYNFDCSGSTAVFDPQKQAYERPDCAAYEGQSAGKYVWDGSAGKSIEGCGWWGRGVIQTTGRLNFGKLNHFLGRSHVDPDNIGQTIEGTLVKPAPENPLYSDLDICSNPELICSTQEHKEIKWIAGLFFWMNEVQGYSNPGGPYASWNYYNELKAYVNGGLVGTKFIDDVSGIVNRGCPDTTCPISGAVDGLPARKDNFVKALRAMGLNPQ